MPEESGLNVSIPSSAAALFFATLPTGQTEERVFVLPLSGDGKVLAKPVLVSVGHGKDSAAVEAGEIFREALKAGAEEIIVAHNHPSGNLAPSKADVAATAKLHEAAKLLDVPLLDHLILGRKPDGSPDFVSLAEAGMQMME